MVGVSFLQLQLSRGLYGCSNNPTVMKGPEYREPPGEKCFSRAGWKGPAEAVSIVGLGDAALAPPVKSPPVRILFV